MMKKNNKITFKVIARKLKRFGGLANLYELSEKIEYEKYISKDVHELGVFRALLGRMINWIKKSLPPRQAIEEIGSVEMIKKTRYVIVWASGCVEETYYSVLPANKFGKPYYCPIYSRESTVYVGFDEIMNECIDSIMKGASNE